MCKCPRCSAREKEEASASATPLAAPSGHVSWMVAGPLLTGPWAIFHFYLIQGNSRSNNPEQPYCNVPQATRARFAKGDYRTGTAQQSGHFVSHSICHYTHELVPFLTLFVDLASPQHRPPSALVRPADRWLGGLGLLPLQGTAMPAWQPTREDRSMTNLGESACTLMSISAMKVGAIA